MNIGSELHAILDRTYRRGAKALLQKESSADLAVYAALWLLVRCGGAINLSCLKKFADAQSVVEPTDDLPALCIAGFRVSARIDSLNPAQKNGIERALQRVLRRKPHTDELSGPADDPLSLLGLVLLARVAAPQLVVALRSWADGVSVLSPSIRAAFILGGVESFEGEARLDKRSPSSLGAFVLIAAADEALGHSLFPATQGSEVASLLATSELHSLQPGSFDALAVLVSLELLLQSYQRVPARGGVSVLVVLANPCGTDGRRLATEERVLREAIKLSKCRDLVDITTLQATTIDDFRRALLRDRYDIVHFSGHGDSSGLGFEDAAGELEVPDPNAFAELLHRRGIKTVLLNACDSLRVSLAGTSKIDYTIAMEGTISNKSAIEFSRGFYDAIGEGRAIPEAFNEGVSSCKLKGLVPSAVLLRKGDQRPTVPCKGVSPRARVSPKRLARRRPEPQYDFFLAYPGERAAEVHELYRALKARGHEVFLDAESLEPGDRWDVAIPAAQRASRLTVVLIPSSDTIGYYDREEVAAAIELVRYESHRVVPLYLDEARPRGVFMPYGLRRIVGVSLATHGVDRAVDKLEVALARERTRSC